MTYQDAVKYLESFNNFEQRHDPEAMRGVRLERMQQLCRRLGDPQRRFRSVLVAGTNGKGSVCAMLYAMLRHSPLRVGLYTSPHLEHLRERVRVWEGAPGRLEGSHGDDWISPESFAALMEQLRPVLEDMRLGGPEEAPTFFEVVTALALLHFSRRRVDVAVLEVGLGGRCDATNVVEQTVSVIGPIDLDHQEVLGADVVSVAREKAGIIKPNQVVLSAAQPEEALGVLRAACDAHGVPLAVYGQDLTARIQHHGLEGLQLSLTGLRGIYESLELPFIGRHQAQNAALAVGALEALSPTGVPYGLVERGLAVAEWPGRCEIVHEAPLVILDGAHNPHAASALAATLQELCGERRIHVLLGMSSDKSVEAVGAILGPLAVSATCTRSRHPRALDPVPLAERAAPFFRDVHVMGDAADAYTYLLNAVSSKDVIVVTGSLFLVGELRGALRQSHIKPRKLQEA